MAIQAQVVQNDQLIALYEYELADNEEVSLLGMISRSVSAFDNQRPVEVTITAKNVSSFTLIDDLGSYDGSFEYALSLVALKDVHMSYRWSIAKTCDVSRGIVAVCDAPGARIDVVCKGLTKGKQKVKVHTAQIHRASHTHSNVLIKGVAQDTSRVEVDTLIHIIDGLKDVSADQMHKQILLDQGARAVSNPKLEVLSDDVSCSHGSAIRYIDQDILFYVKSRGLSHDTARTSLITAFLDDSGSAQSFDSTQQ